MVKNISRYVVLCVILLAFLCTACESNTGGIRNNKKALPKASFDYVITNAGILPAIVKFTQLTNEHSFNWKFNWVFGDGTSINGARSPIHKYDKSGKYKVRLIAINSAGSDTTEKMITIPPVDTTPAHIDGYKLVWHDEFNKGRKPNSANWSYEHGFIRNKEPQWYQSDNVHIKHGVLDIVVKNERVTNPNYDPSSSNWRLNRHYANFTSGSIFTRGKKSFTYGIFIFRAKIDKAKGLWPAIWFEGEVETKGKSWPEIGEIDLMEYYPVNGKLAMHANAAWGNGTWDSKWLPLSHFLNEDPYWALEYHKWKMKWTPQTIKLYLDDELINEIGLSKTVNADGFNPFHHAQFIRINLAIRSNYKNSIIYPKHLKVDYVRVYQKK